MVAVTLGHSVTIVWKIVCIYAAVLYSNKTCYRSNEKEAVQRNNRAIISMNPLRTCSLFKRRMIAKIQAESFLVKYRNSTRRIGCIEKAPVSIEIPGFGCWADRYLITTFYSSIFSHLFIFYIIYILPYILLFIGLFYGQIYFASLHSIIILYILYILDILFISCIYINIYIFLTLVIVYKLVMSLFIDVLFFLIPYHSSVII